MRKEEVGTRSEKGEVTKHRIYGGVICVLYHGVSCVLGAEEVALS